MTSTLPLSQLLFEDGHMKQDLLVNTGEAEVSKERTGEAAASVSEIITSAFPSKKLYKPRHESVIIRKVLFSLRCRERTKMTYRLRVIRAQCRECRVEPKH